MGNFRCDFFIIVFALSKMLENNFGRTSGQTHGPTDGHCIVELENDEVKHFLQQRKKKR